jgi:iron(III) transport system permease protein
MSVSTSDGVAEEVLGSAAAADMAPGPVGHGRRGWRRLRPHPSLLLVLLLGLLVVPPLVIMAWQSFNSDPILGRHGLFNAYQALVDSTDLVRSGKGTLIFSVGSSVCALAFGMTLAWLVARTDMPAKWLAYLTAFLGFALPGMVKIIGWILLFGPNNGVVNQFCRSHLAGTCDFNVQSMAGMVLVESLLFTPMVFLMAVGPLRSIDPSLEEAAKVAGGGRLMVLRRVTLPLLWPTFASVFLLMAIRSVQSFEVPIFLGVPANVHVFTADIYRGLHDSFIADYASTSAYGVILVLILGLLLLAQNRIVRASHKYQVVGGKSFRPAPLALGKGKWVAVAFMLLLLLTYLVPVLAVFVASFQRNFGGTLSQWTTANYHTLFNYPQFWSALRNSIAVGVLTATAATVLGALAAWVIVRRRGRTGAVLAQLAGLPLAVPGVVMGLAFLVLYLHVHIGVYGTIFGITLAFLANYVPYAVRYAEPGLMGIKPELEEAARVSGLTPIRVLRHVTVPLVRAPLLGGWSFIFFNSFRELSIAAFLVTATSPLLSTQLLDLFVNGNLSVVAALGVVITVVSLVIGLATLRVTKLRF